VTRSTVTRTVDPDSLDLRRSAPADERDAALKMIERATADTKMPISSERADALDALVRSVDADDRDASELGRELSRRTVATMNPAYQAGFKRYMRALGQPGRGRTVYTAAEESAIAVVREELMRTASEGGSFGLAVPTVIDPTIVVSGGEVAPIAAAAHIVTTVSDVWKGVTSAPPSWSWDAESAVVADDTPTLVQPNIPIYKADSYIPATFEVWQDYGADGFIAEFSNHLNTGFLDLLSQATAVGTGSSQPTGLFTAMAATTTNPSHVTAQTAGQLAVTDIRAAWKALPPRYRANASWVMSEGVLNQIRSFNTTGPQVDLVTDRQGVTLMGRPVLQTDYAPGWTATTGAASILVVGDLSGYTIPVRLGMTVEVVDSAFDAATMRPIAQRGLYAMARVGANVSVPAALRLLSNT
jgi:HK97 family phage major capsid protein